MKFHLSILPFAIGAIIVPFVLFGSFTYGAEATGMAQASIPVVAPATTAHATSAATTVNPAIVPTKKLDTQHPGWSALHQQFVEQAKKGDIDLLFVGDSIFEFLLDDAPNSTHRGKPVWDKYYGGRKAADFGLGGDETQQVLWRLQNGEGQGFQPKVVVLLIGANNAAGVSRNQTTSQVVAGVTAVVQELRRDFPEAKILLLGLLPSGTKSLNVKFANANQGIAKLDDQQHVFYLDVGQKFLGADGLVPADLMPDHYHPSEKGYGILAEAIKEPLDKLLGNATASATKVAKGADSTSP